MRLLSIQTFEIEEFYDPPKYAILSHTWDKEMTLQEWQLSPTQVRGKYSKVIGAANQAIRDGLAYIWIDTICIDKTSSAELSEAINSMFSWYEAAEICYAYLSDVVFDGLGKVDESLIYASRWFTRGWILQELIAPPELIFYSSEWRKIGTRHQLHLLVSHITKIDSSYLVGERSERPEDRTMTIASCLRPRTPFHYATNAERLSWVSNRVTTRPEDIAYCLLGLFRINMPLLYGERSNAWIRLQKEPIAVSDDESIFTWVSVPRLEVLMNDNLDKTSLMEGPTTRLDHLIRTGWKYLGGSTMFAPDPVNFYCRELRYSILYKTKLPYSMTNADLFMKLPLIHVGFNSLFPIYLAALHCGPLIGGSYATAFDAVILNRCEFSGPNSYRRDRCRFLGSQIWVDTVHIDFNSATEVYIEDLKNGVYPSHELAFKLDKAFLGFWIAFPRGLHPYKVLPYQWGQKTKYARSDPHMGILGFNIGSSQKDYFGTLVFYKDDIKTHLLDLGILLDSHGEVSWTFKMTACETNHRTHESKAGQPTNLTVEQQNDNIPSQIDVSFGIVNTSRLNDWKVRMTYITFHDDNEIMKGRRRRFEGVIGPIRSRSSLIL
ncbi:heterokaryon incompatibility protein-domain-containing protein [Xylaria castorea]|nr:heterokaryon incompatibility protein-domain-containing protein [Xylaria castorea]